MTAVDTDENDATDKIVLSKYTQAFLAAIHSLPPKKRANSTSGLQVSKTVSFFAILYEKIRNSIEFREEHLVRRAAIERILKRRLSINPQGKGEGENLMRELLWARYFSEDDMDQQDIQRMQTIIDAYIQFKQLLTQKLKKFSEYDWQFWHEMLTAEIEEGLDPRQTAKEAAYLYFLFQVLKNKVTLEGIEPEERDSFFYTACEVAYRKNDRPYIRQHLFSLSYGPLSKLSRERTAYAAEHWPQITKQIDKIMANPYTDRLTRFVRKQVAPFRILFELVDQNESHMESILSTQAALQKQVILICEQKYQETNLRLRTAAIRSIVYIFLTKMIFVLLLEVPLTRAFYDDFEYIPLAINTLFPPLFMGLIVSFIHVPGLKNTERIYQRIMEILNRDPGFETARAFTASPRKVRRPLLFFAFSILYVITFSLTFSLIYYGLQLLNFNFLGKIVFMFFLSVVAFFGYRIRQTAKEYSLEDGENIFTPFVHFLFLPILSVGKFLSREVAKLNILIYLFDVLIEAPFKLIFEIVEEWVKFVRQRKDEIM